MSGRRSVERDAMSDVERQIGLVLIVLTDVAVVLLIVGVGLMVVRGIGPLDGGPAFAPATLVADLLALDPAGPLWLGIVLILVTPITRATLAGIGYARQREWTMVVIAIAILVVIAIGVATALLTEV